MNWAQRIRTHRKRTLTLLDEAQVLIILLIAVTIIGAELISLVQISERRIESLKQRSFITANQLAVLLEEPMYSVDDTQTRRICKALLSSGDISGVILDSVVSGRLMDEQPKETSKLIPAQKRNIYRSGLLVGTVDIFFEDNEINILLTELFQMALSIIVAVILFSVLLTRFVLVRRILKSFDPISAGINAISHGDYNSRIPLGRYRDVNIFTQLINDMASKILFKNGELLEANNLLEKRVLERTEDLELAQGKLVLSEKLSALGQLSAGVAHELNTPLGAISSSVGLLREFTDSSLVDLLKLYSEMDVKEREFFLTVLDLSFKSDIKTYTGHERKMRKELQQRLENEGAVHAQVIAEQIMEMGLFAQVDTIMPFLHEPWVSHCLAAAEQVVTARKMTDIIDIAVSKSVVVVGALRSYLRDGPSGSLEVIDIGADIDTILTLIQNKTKNEVQIIRDYRSGPALGSLQSLSQVWLNLINNALQAMNYKGILTIQTETVDNQVLVRIIDNGCGISDDVRPHIFEPFFTTKKYGEGMGLGLDICKRIVEQYGGSILFESRPGFTCFTVKLLSAK